MPFGLLAGRVLRVGVGLEADGSLAAAVGDRGVRVCQRALEYMLVNKLEARAVIIFVAVLVPGATLQVGDGAGVERVRDVRRPSELFIVLDVYDLVHALQVTADSIPPHEAA
eukprot:COSAG04_NODE_14269_length_574_cov_587.210526_2_plen_111_part_01